MVRNSLPQGINDVAESIAYDRFRCLFFKVQKSVQENLLVVSFWIDLLFESDDADFT